MLSSHLVVRHIRVAKLHFRAVRAPCECDRHDRLESARRFRHPGELDLASSIQTNETAVVRPLPAFVFHDVIKRPSTTGSTMARSTPNQMPPGLLRSSHASKTSSAEA